MSFKKRVLPALLASTLTLGASAAQALTFNGVYVFGDSLSDAGYFRGALIAGGVPAAQAAQLGRFTTNPDRVFAEIIAQYYGGNPNPSNAGGQNYAQGGARVNAPNMIPGTVPAGFTQRPVSTQITEFLTSNGGRADPNALYSVFAGANDLFQVSAMLVSPANTPAFLDATTQAEVDQVRRLRDAGAKYILVFNIPDIGNTPFAIAGGPANVAAARQLSVGYNINLQNKLAQAGLRVIPVDTFSLITEVTATPAAFGFSNITGVACQLPPNTSLIACGRNNLVNPNAATTFIYADGVHPTGATQAILADFAKSLIDGPNAYSTMTEVALSTRAAHISTLDEALQLGATAQVGRFSAFATGGGGKYDISTNTLSPRTDTKNRSATVGVTFRASEAFTLGVGFGKTTADIDMGSVGKYETDESLLSLFGAFKSGGWYANFTASLADVKFDNVQRFVKLGPVTRNEQSNTKGSNGSASFTLGYDCKAGPVSVGPFASVTTQSVTVNGFTESAGSTVLSTDLRIFEQKRSSQVTSVGVRASATFGSWTPFARVSFDKEEKNDDRFVTATPVTVAQGIQYDIPGYRGDSKWGTAVIGVRGKVTDRIGLALVYSNVFSRSDVKQDGVTGTVSFDF